MNKRSYFGIGLIIASYLPLLFRLTYPYSDWWIYVIKMLVDASYVSFAWLIASGFRQGIVRRFLTQSFHGKFHNYLGYIALIGILIHPAVYIVWWGDWKIIIPFAHDFGIYISLGGVAFCIGIIIGLSSYFLRKRYFDLWSVLHYLNYVFFIVIFIHVWQSLPLYSPTGFYYILVFVITVGLMFYKWAFDLRLLSFKVEITSFAEVAKDTYSIKFPVRKDLILTWEPGQYVMLTIDKTDDQHPFSVCRIYDNNTVEITFKVFGNFTQKMAGLSPGDTIYVAGPYGTASKMVEHSFNDLVLLAGGIGITPFRAIIYRLLETNDLRTITLIYCVSDIEYFAFDDEFTELAKHHANFNYIKLCAKPTNDRTIIQGYINEDIIRGVVKDVRGASYMVCGPDQMLAAVQVLLKQSGVPRYQIHKEEFSY